MKTILVDTNFLIECAKHKVDIHSELTRVLDTSFEVAVLDRTLEELDTVIARGKNEGKAAKLAKTILLTKHVTIMATSGGHTDNLLLEKADENHIVATMDRALKQRLKKKKQDVIIIRGQKKLAVMKA
jgi:rRNA-processing protein FCF1